MTSLIIQTAATLLQPLLLLFSVFLLFQGHNAPGGGFTGGLVAAAAFALRVVAYSPASARGRLHVEPRHLVVAGLLIAFATAVGPLFSGLPLLTAAWTELALPEMGTMAIGTPLLFDVGVYLVVFGGTLMVILNLAEA